MPLRDLLYVVKRFSYQAGSTSRRAELRVSQVPRKALSGLGSKGGFISGRATTGDKWLIVVHHS